MIMLCYKGLEVGKLYRCRSMGTWCPVGVVMLIKISVRHENFLGEIFDNFVFLTADKVQTFSYLACEQPQWDWVDLTKQPGNIR